MFIRYVDIKWKDRKCICDDKKSKDMENSLLSFYIKDVSNVESIKYIPLDKKS